jgi:hypothetical protein
LRRGVQGSRQEGLTSAGRCQASVDMSFGFMDNGT